MQKHDKRSTNIKWFNRLGSLVFLFFSLQSFSLTVEVSDSPTSNLALTLKTILSAKKSIYMNAYELTSVEISSALIKQIKNGIHVEILLEAEPCCTKELSKEGLEVKSKIIKAMNQAPNIGNRFFVMSSQEGTVERRFSFDHAKYIIVDEEALLVGSENYTSSGNPVPNVNKGNRGWQTFVHDEQVAKNFLKLFLEDAKLDYEDVTLENKPQLNFFYQSPQVDIEQLSPDLSMAVESWATKGTVPITLPATHIEQITSPNTSLDGIVAFIRSAKKTLDLELMSFNSRWGTKGEKSPLIDELIAASKRGVQVRLLLNDENAFHPNEPSDNSVNQRTVDFLINLAKKEKLNIKAVIANIDEMGVNYIHNKGVLADGFKTLVSSINWNQNSVLKNRETAISINSPEINQHYLSLFEKDWKVSYR